MANPAAKKTMRISAPGNSRGRIQAPARASGRGGLNAIARANGFTLIEILAVMVIIALGTALMSLSLGSSNESRSRADALALATFFKRVADEAAYRGETLRVTESGGRFVVTQTSNPAADPLPALNVSARVVALTGGQLPEPGIVFPPGGGGAFSLTLEFRDQQFQVARDALSRLTVRRP